MEFEPKLYNPAAQPEEWLIEHFVVRTKVFAQLFDAIKSGDMRHPEQHYLIQGQRGMGKTTLLLRLKYEIERTPELKDWLVPVFFNEESYDLTSLSNLWEKLLKYFDSNFPDGGDYYKATDKFIGTNDYEQRCFKLVIDALHKHHKKLIILFDNFGELFLDNLNERDSHRFREILMNCVDLRIVAASAVVLESHNDYSEPFFDFFRVINLEGLSKEETLDLIKKLQEKSARQVDIAANKARIETLAILTGGVIRTIIMLYEILLNDNDGSALKDLESILDKVTPLYKHRMEDLKPQQRRIMDVIAKNWDAVSVKEIAENIRENGNPLASKIVSAQLQELEKNNLIEKIKTSTKNNFYIVKERFFNIWYLMRHGDATSQCKVKWLTRFLEMWYGDDNYGMDGFIQEYINKLQAGNFISSSAISITNALLSSSQTSPVNQALLIDATATIVSEPEARYLPQIKQSEIDEINHQFDLQNYKSVIDLIENTTPKTVALISTLGASYFLIDDYSKAIYYLSHVKHIKENEFLSYCLGQAYFYSNEIDKALEYLLCALPEYLYLSAPVLGDIYKRLGDNDTSEKYFNYPLDGNNIEEYTKLFQYYLSLENIDETIYVLKKVEKLSNNNTFIQIFLGLVYWQKSDMEFCEKYLNQALANISKMKPRKAYKTIETRLKMMLMGVYFNKAKNKKKAIEYLNEIISLNGSESFEPPIASILLWNNDIERAIMTMHSYLERTKLPEIETSLSIINKFLMVLSSKKQYHSSLKIFNNNSHLKEMFKPTYYALMYLLKDEYPDEYIKMGKELEEPVQDILRRIEQYAVDYA